MEVETFDVADQGLANNQNCENKEKINHSSVWKFGLMVLRSLFVDVEPKTNQESEGNHFNELVGVGLDILGEGLTG